MVDLLETLALPYGAVCMPRPSPMRSKLAKPALRVAGQRQRWRAGLQLPLLFFFSTLRYTVRCVVTASASYLFSFTRAVDGPPEHERCLPFFCLSY